MGTVSKRHYRTSRQDFRKKDNQQLKQNFQSITKKATHWGQPHYRKDSQPQERKRFDKLNGYPTMAEAFEKAKRCKKCK